jgi:histidine ammonia-lyase
MNKKEILIGFKKVLTLKDFFNVIDDDEYKINIENEVIDRLDETREFINYLLEKNMPVYGLTTGFADLRDCVVKPEDSKKLSKNIINSHDAGIGKSIDNKAILGAMLLRTHNLALGYSGFSKESLKVLIEMVNNRIIPEIPSLFK